MRYLPSEWSGKRMFVAFEREAGAGVVGTLVSENAGGVLLEAESPDPQPPTPLRAFIPWTGIQYVHLLEETESPRSLAVREIPRGF